jgi:thiopeptide-type bacteriocin biosynthesis protein
MKDVKRKYPPGSEWLYLRIYGGPKTIEEWLINHLPSLLTEWRQKCLIGHFHYLHYLDPDYHLRIRFHLPDPNKSGIILSQIQQSCLDFLQEDLLWKMEVGTYEPEYERYGHSRMCMVEKWFECDSMFWIAERKRLCIIEDQDIWISAARTVDHILGEFGAQLEEKSSIMSGLRDSTSTFFKLSRTMKNDLDEKYRKNAKELSNALDQNYNGFESNICKHSTDLKEIIKQLHATFDNPAELFDSRLLPDLIHLSLNRAFRTRHRLQEFVIYDHMSRYYESLSARAKDDNSIA